MPVPLFAHRPARCPFGHSLAPGRPQLVGWTPCLCAPAQEAAAPGLGMGHLRVQCETCRQDHRQTLFFEPSHDVAYRDPGPRRQPQ